MSLLVGMMALECADSSPIADARTRIVLIIQFSLDVIRMPVAYESKSIVLDGQFGDVARTYRERWMCSMPHDHTHQRVSALPAATRVHCLPVRSVTMSGRGTLSMSPG